MKAEICRSSSSADTYIGSLISLTSKSEVRYEGVLYSINTDESTIGLRNVKSFGTEGRKKDGPQVPPIDKLYEYILFRGSDVKDLQVKATPTVQSAAPPLINDPSIIQINSHYSQPATITPNIQSTVSPSLTYLNSHTSQGSTFQNGFPLHQPGGNLGQMDPQSASGNGPNGLSMPMSWQGYYGPSKKGLPNLQPSLLRPPHGSSLSPFMHQPLQYPSGTSNVTFPNSLENPSPFLLPPIFGSLNLTSTFPSTLPPLPSLTLSPETVPVTLNANLRIPPSNEEANAVLPPISSNRPLTISSPVSLITPGSQVVIPAPAPAPTPSLITPGQFLQPESVVVSSAKSLQATRKDRASVLVSSPPLSYEQPAPASTKSQPPIFPSPEQPSQTVQKINEAPRHNNRTNYRGRERGRGARGSNPITKFTEDFDFIAMNEKFNKDEVWDHLGKNNNKSHINECDENGSDEDDDYEDDEHDTELEKHETKVVYNKDDFFDSLSSDALDRESNNGRLSFSVQMKLDTETFGEFPRYHRGGRGYGRGGGSYRRGSYHGRGGGGFYRRGGGFNGGEWHVRDNP